MTLDPQDTSDNTIVADAIEKVGQAIALLATSLDNNVENVARATHRRGRPFRVVVLTFVTVMIVLLSVGTSWIKTIHDNSETNKGIIASTEEATNIIKSCLEPTGECFQGINSVQAGVINGVEANNEQARVVQAHRFECIVDGNSADFCIAKFPTD